jgi:hypothetical protein
MNMERVERAHGIPAGVRIWRHGGEIPDWIKSQLAGSIATNGTFLIETPLGRQRVHRGYVVIEQGGLLYACPASEAASIVREGASASAVASDPAILVGPGKSLKTARRSLGNKRGAATSKRTFAPPRGTRPSIENVLVGELLIDPDYQRSIDTEPSRRLIAAIAARWDWRLCMALSVSRRDDGNYVIDGQHRLAAAKLRGDIDQLPCCLVRYSGPAEEAAMFVTANRVRRAINRLDDFHAALVAGDEDAIEVREVVERAGLKVARQTGSQAWRPGEVAFTSSVQSVLGKHGDDIVVESLKAIADAFPGEVLSNGASIFLGLSRILVHPPEDLDRERLFKALGAHSMKQWGAFVQQVKGGDLRAQVMRQALLAAYSLLE